LITFIQKEAFRRVEQRGSFLKRGPRNSYVKFAFLVTFWKKSKVRVCAASEGRSTVADRSAR
jgi:hypothetical protein